MIAEHKNKLKCEIYNDSMQNWKSKPIQKATIVKQDVVPDDYEYLKTQVNLYEAEKKHFDEAMQKQIVKNALAELIDFMNRYRDIKEFAELFEVIERVTNEQITT